jgi:hypothetical protein
VGPGVRIVAAGGRVPPGPRSHLPDGRTVVLSGGTRPGTRAAVDAELDLPGPSRLVGRYGEDLFWERWTVAECAAKLLGVPIAIWLRRHGLEPPPSVGLSFETFRIGGPGPDVVVTVGTCPSD